MPATKERPTVTMTDLDTKSKQELVAIAEEAGLDGNGQLSSRPREEVLSRVLHFLADKEKLSPWASWRPCPRDMVSCARKLSGPHRETSTYPSPRFAGSP